MDGKNNELIPAIVYGSWTCEPSVDRDGTILFVAKTNELDGLPQSPFNYDLFLLKDKKIDRITTNQRYVDYASLSLDGSRILFARTQEEKEKSIVRCYIVNADGNNSREVLKTRINTGEIK